jgi:hypothetical protein
MVRTEEKDRTQGAADRDTIIGDYRALLSELALLTTISVLLFGFLLTVAIGESLTLAEEWLLLLSLVSVASATLIFAMPVVYHRIQFPYQNWEKFQRRSHGFITIGFPVFVAGFFMSLSLAIWDQLGPPALAVAAVPLAIALLLFVGRRSISA